MSSNTARTGANAVRKLLLCLIFALAAPLHAQDDSSAEPVAEPAESTEPEEPFRLDLTVTVPRGDVNESKVRACEDEAEGASISGEIIVCRQLEEDNSFYYSGSRDAARARYAAETQDLNNPKAPDFILDCKEQGNPPGCISFGSVPPPALIIDVEALPEAPPGSDADRVGRGLAPLGRELTEEEEKARREALGLETPE